MRTIIIVIALLNLSFTQDCFSQTNSIPLKSLLIDEQTSKPITYAHIYNESQRYGVISDSNGHFRMHAQAGDTLIFIALGYYGNYYTVKTEDFDSILIVQLLERSYKIEEVSIQLPRTYKHFKQALLKVDTDKDRPIPEMPRHNKYKIPSLLDTNVIHSAGFMIMHPVSGLYYRFSKEEKSKRKVWHAQQQELKQSRVDEKFSRELVREITNFTGDELTQFIGFCNFSFNYLFETTPYGIIQAIEDKYKECLICCYDK